MYRCGARLLLTPFGVAVLALVALGGTAAAVVSRTAGTAPVELSATVTIVVLIVAGWVSVFSHETAHALVIHHGGRRVGRAGFGFHWGSLSFYVDATDALFLPRRRRAAQAAAGPAADATLAGICGVVALATAGHAVSVVAAQLALLAWLDVAINVVPFLELDGYWILADLLDTPDLAERSRHAMLHPGRRHVGLAAYAAASTVFGIALLAGVIVAWIGEFGPLVAAAWAQGPGGVVAVVAFCGPLAAGLTLCLARVGLDLLNQPTMERG